MVSFRIFFIIWAKLQGWDVPFFHLLVCDFLDQDEAGEYLLMMPRGHGKSTILGIYNAYKFYKDASWRLLHQGDQDSTARKCSRDTKAILAKHPLTKHLTIAKGDVDFWWVDGYTDERNPSMQAAGILSNITSSRADEIQNDDVEVPKNIGSPEMRAKLRYRLSEQIHVAVPNTKTLYVGTPHTYDTLYNDVKDRGAKCLILKMFEDEARFEDKAKQVKTVSFEPKNIFVNIGKTSKRLTENTDYIIEHFNDQYRIVLNKCYPLVDIYGDALWADRFTPKEMESRRKKCNTLNEWDSQYQLHAKPIGELRLNPDHMKIYDVEPVIKTANGETTMWLGEVQIVSGALRLDPSSGKTHSDTSALCLLLQDEQGRYFWHRSIGLKGEIATYDDETDRINGGQVWQICDVIEEFCIGRITIETNGVGTHVPSILRAALKTRKLRCGISEEHSSKSKNKRILGAIEAPLTSGILWAHKSIVETEENGKVVTAAPKQEMQQFNPSITQQDDDHLDALAGAIMDGPCRLGKALKIVNGNSSNNWRKVQGSFKAELV